MRNARTTDPTQTALTVDFCSLRPKKKHKRRADGRQQRDEPDVV